MKKISPRLYASALLETSRGQTGPQLERLLDNFLALIQKNGDWPRLKEIAAVCERAWRKEKNRPLLTIESARPLHERHKKLLAQGKGHADVQEKIVPELIAGARLTIDEEYQLDSSLRRILQKLFT